MQTLLRLERQNSFKSLDANFRLDLRVAVEVKIGVHSSHLTRRDIFARVVIDGGAEHAQLALNLNKLVNRDFGIRHQQAQIRLPFLPLLNRVQTIIDCAKL